MKAHTSVGLEASPKKAKHSSVDGARSTALKMQSGTFWAQEVRKELLAVGSMQTRKEGVAVDACSRFWGRFCRMSMRLWDSAGWI